MVFSGHYTDPSVIGSSLLAAGLNSALAEKIAVFESYSREAAELLNDWSLDQPMLLRRRFLDETIIIPSCSHKQSLHEARDLFTISDENLFRIQNDQQTAAATDQLKIEVFDLLHTASWLKVMEHFADKPEDICIRQSQIVQFIRENERYFGKTTNMRATFNNFFFQCGDSTYVAAIAVSESGLRTLSCLSNLHTKLRVSEQGDRHRFFIPNYDAVSILDYADDTLERGIDQRLGGAMIEAGLAENIAAECGAAEARLQAVVTCLHRHFQIADAD